MASDNRRAFTVAGLVVVTLVSAFIAAYVVSARAQQPGVAALTPDTTVELALIFSAIGSVVAILAVIRFWMDVGAWRKVVIIAEQDVAKLKEQVLQLERELQAYKLYSSDHFVTNPALISAEKRFVEAIEGVRRDVNNMSNRFDTVVMSLIKQNATQV